MQVLAGANLLLVPAAVAEDESVQGPEPVRLRITRRPCAHRRHELPHAERICGLPVREHPAVRRSCPDRSAESGDVSRRETGSAVPVALLERGRELDLDQLPTAKSPDKRRPEAVVRQNLARAVLELGERPETVTRDQLLRRSKAVDALLGIDDQDSCELVDAVDRAHIDAGLVFDVDAGLGDDVRHARESSLSPRALRRPSDRVPT